MPLAEGIARDLGLFGLRPRMAPGISVRCIDSGGAPLWVLHNPATGRYFHASGALYRLMCRMDGALAVEAALDSLCERDGPGDAGIRDLAQGLRGALGAGLLVEDRLHPRRPQTSAIIRAAGRVAFSRLHLGDLAPAARMAAPVLGWLFTPAGALLLALLLASAAMQWSGLGADIANQMARLGQLGTQDLLWGYLVFILAKALHELGHAIALERMLREEGLHDAAKPFGLSFMFLMPAPYVDASAAWLLERPRRRVVVGLAGVATDLLVAAIAAWLWTALGPGFLRDRAFDLVLICSVSSLAFNLNPLAKLDAYYVVSDLLGVPNLMERARRAFWKIALAAFGVTASPTRADLPLATYFALSAAYRWTMYVSIVFLALGVSDILAAGALAVVAVLFVALPVYRGLVSMARSFSTAPLGVVSLLALLVLLAAGAALVPVPRSIVAEGVVVNTGLRLVYPRTDARIAFVAPTAIVDGADLLRLENPELERALLQLRFDDAAAALEMRHAQALAPERLDAILARRSAIAQQIARLEAERASWVIRSEGKVAWEPLFADSLTDAWVRRSEGRPLGFTIAGNDVEIRLLLDQWDGPAALGALAEAGDVDIPLRLRGMTASDFRGRARHLPTEGRDSLVSAALAQSAGGRIRARIDEAGVARPAERVFELAVVPVGDGLPRLLHGARVEARIALPPQPLLDQVLHRLQQTAQRRLPV